jgi:hypothetical protein
LISEITSDWVQLTEAENSVRAIPNAHPSPLILRQSRANEEDGG